MNCLPLLIWQWDCDVPSVPLTPEQRERRILAWIIVFYVTSVLVSAGLFLCCCCRVIWKIKENRRRGPDADNDNDIELQQAHIDA